MRTIPNLGIENTAIQLGDPTAAPQRTAGRSTLAWNMISIHSNKVRLMSTHTYCLHLH